jgi:hypothetical protein
VDEWPEEPTLRFFVHMALRREELCDPNLCHDRPEGESRCNKCPLDRLDEAQKSWLGSLLRRALDLRAALKLGVNITLEEIAADELYALLVIEDEGDKREEEKSKNGGQ